MITKQPYHILVLVMCIIVAISVDVKAQLISGSSTEGIDIPFDTLRLKEEWWIGASVSAHYAMGFGTLTVQYVGGTAPDAPTLSAQTQGGFGYGVAIAPSIEYRSYNSPLGLMLNLGVDYRYATSTSTTPVSNGIYAYNATFESNSSILYGTVTLLAKYSLGSRGFFVIGGPFLDLPLSSNSYIWQHELLPPDEVVGEEPGFPNTSIKFATTPDMRPRVGFQIGFGTDIMTGLFGYTSQLVSPFILIQGATPVVSDPTAWNSLMFRGGVIWRVGL
ncbi:MAG TPA: hypothetical protein VK147_08705 [Candidatus Didemnitutus sp.]|nr:hypothetical protein [Candidatus Didemnitutus sp.]